MTRTDEELARLIAQDLTEYLATVPLAGPAFALALWIDEGYGSADGAAWFGISVGSDADFAQRRAPGRQDLADEYWYGWPSSDRWNSGYWSHTAERFTRPRTEAELEPLRDRIRVEDLEADDGACDLSWPCSCLPPVARRWTEVGLQALALTAMPPALACTPDVLVFAEADDLNAAQRAMAMLRTVTPARFHAMFPAWRQLADAIRTVRAEAEPNEFTALLMACDLHWSDVTTHSPALRQALLVADAR